MKTILTALAAIILATSVFAMGSTPKAETADQVQARETEMQMRDAVQQVGNPGVVNFTERRLVKWLYELRDEPNYQTYSYMVTLTGELIKICDSVGYGINASIQFTNPEKMVHPGDNFDFGPTYAPQPEPNGLFMPEGLAATYVMCVKPGTEDVQAVYVEPEVIVSPFKLD